MEYAHEERIGNPDLVTGRKKELAYFLKWIDDIKESRELKLEMSDGELELKLKALVKSDIIMQGRTNYDYQGVKDNIFDKVFRGVYEKEIREFDVRVIKKEYSEEFKELKKKYDSFRAGFTTEAEEYCKEKGIAWSEDDSWLEK